MLNKKNRLRKKKEFNFIYKKGQVYYSKFFAMHVVKTKLKDKKIGFSVSNKIGNSVIRHKVKRKFTEVIRQNLDKLPLNNYIFVARTGCENLNFQQMTDNFLYLVNKVLKVNDEN